VRKTGVSPADVCRRRRLKCHGATSPPLLPSGASGSRAIYGSGTVKRLDEWPNHKLTFGMAVCFGGMPALVSASDGQLDWLFWGGLFVMVGFIVIGVREKGRADRAGLSD